MIHYSLASQFCRYLNPTSFKDFQGQNRSPSIQYIPRSSSDVSGRGQRGGLSADGGSEGPTGHATIHGKKSWDNIGEP